MPRKPGRAASDVESLPPEVRFKLLLRATQQLRRRFAADRGIRSVAFGYKHTAGELTRTLCVRFYVRRKIVRPGEARAIPKSIRVRVQHEGVRYAFTVPTDIIEAPGIDRLETHAKRPKLAPSIFNTTNPNEYGTATALVTDAAGGTSLLTAAHVAACVLLSPSAALGTAVDSDNAPGVGTLAAYPAVGASGIDAAIVELSPGTDGRSLVPRPNGAPVAKVCPESESILLDPGSFTMYSFRRTRSMTFQAAHPDFTVSDIYAEGPVTFPLILEFECGAEGGDSGSMVVDGAGRAVGMHIMGMKGDARYGYSVPIGRVLAGVRPGVTLGLAY